MNIKEEIVTKRYLTEELERRDYVTKQFLFEELDRRDYVSKSYLAQEFDKFRNEIDLKFHDFSNLILSEMGRYIGVVMEHMNDKFKIQSEAFSGIPEIVQNLRDRSINNDYEHNEFRIRLGILESEKKKK